jgi:long-chain acyl-CoA synthetase
MRGYHNLPEETAAALTGDGWLRTGDIGELDEEGFLRITDRIKDLIKTSGGKYVAPQSIEIAFKAVCPHEAEIVVYGEGRPNCVGLVAFDPEALARGPGQRSWSSLRRRAGRQQLVRALIAGSVRRPTAACRVGRQSSGFEVLRRELTVEAGDLTPSLKLKRRVVTTKHRDLLESLDASAAAITADRSGTASSNPRPRTTAVPATLSCRACLRASTAASTTQVSGTRLPARPS